MQRVKERINIRLVIEVLIILVMGSAVAQVISQGNMEKNVSRRALEEVRETTKEQADRVSESIRNQMESLEFLADYIGNLEDFNAGNYEGVFRSYLDSMHYHSIFYIEKNGVIKSTITSMEDGSGNDNIESIVQKNKLAKVREPMILHLSGKEIDTDESVLIAVPVTHKKKNIGVLCSTTSQDDFESILWNGNIDDSKNVFLMEQSGLILADMNNSGPNQNDANFFSGLEESTGSSMQNSIDIYKEGSFTNTTDEMKYIAYSATEYNEWLVVCTMDHESAFNIYSKEMTNIAHKVYLLAIIFVVCGIIIIILFFRVEKAYKNKTEDLEKTSKKLQDYMEKSGSMTFEFDNRDMKLHVSDSLVEYLGYRPPEDFVNDLNERTPYHPEFDYHGILEAYNDLMVSGEHKEMVTSIRLLGKGLRWIEMSMTQTADFEGNVTGIFGNITDVTEEYLNKKAEEEETNIILSSIFNVIPMTFTGNLTKNEYSLLNHQSFIAKVLPLSGRYDDITAFVAESVPETHREIFMEKFSIESLMLAYLDGNTKVEYEHPIQIPRVNLTKWFSSRAYFLNNPVNSDVKVLVMAIDITSQKKNEMLLQKNYDFTIENMPGFVCKWVFMDNDLLLLDGNKAFYQFMKAPKQEVLGKSVIYGFNEQEKLQVVNLFREQEKEKKDIHYTGHGYKYTGEEFWMTMNGTYYGKQGGRSVYFCVINDITESVFLRKKILIDNKELRLAAQQSNSLVLKYDVLDRKIHVISGDKRYLNVTKLDGHSPEYAMDIGLVPVVAGTCFYGAISDVERGVEEGEMRFIAGDSNEYDWVTGTYRTVFNEDGEPVSAILGLRPKRFQNLSETEKVIVDYYRRPNSSKRKMFVVNLVTGRIMYENESDGFVFSAKGIFTFDELKKYADEHNLVEPQCYKECLEFFDREKLIERFRSGVQETIIQYVGSTLYGKRRNVSVYVTMQEIQSDQDVLAYFMFVDTQKADENMANDEVLDQRMNGESKKVSIRAFGYFDVFVNGKAVAFKYEKAKEMLAVLVERRGGFVTSSEMIGYLWEDESANKTTQSRCRQVASRLRKILDENGIGDIIETVSGDRRIIPEKVECDYFDYCNDCVKNQYLFTGSYMTNYSWGEMTLAQIENGKLNFFKK